MDLLATKSRYTIGSFLDHCLQKNCRDLDLSLSSYSLPEKIHQVILGLLITACMTSEQVVGYLPESCIWFPKIEKGDL